MTRKQRIQDALTQHFNLEHLAIEDESYRHKVPEGSESHFKVVLVSKQFEPLTRVQRHRLINKQLEPEFQSGLHALSLLLYTPSEWKELNGRVKNSPPCQNQRKS